MRFQDRREAGRLLAEHLRDQDIHPDLVLGIARGGAVIAREVAAALGAELGVLAVRKVAAPWNREYALGAVASGVAPWIDHARAHELGVDADHLAVEIDRQQRECARQQADFARFGSPPVEDRDVLIVDDAIVTGASARVAIRVARSLGARSITVAVPVAAAQAGARLREEASSLHCLAMEPNVAWAGVFYDDFQAVEEEDVCRILALAHDANPVAVRPVSIPCNGVSLSATLELPPGPGPFPAAILVPGRDEKRDSPGLRALASELRESGLATLRFDLTGCEPRRCMRDLAAVFAWSLRSPDLDPHRIATFGRGLGAWVVVRAAVDGQIGPAAIALWSPPLQRSDLVTLEAPCLLVIGEQDSNLAGVAEAAAANRRARLEIVGGAGYRLSERGALETATRFVTQWLGEQLHARQTASV